MKLDGLAPLYKDMRAKKLERIRFDYRHGRVSFDVFFFIDGSPYLLLFGARGYNLVFEVEVKPGFEIDPRLRNTDYKALCNALGLVFNPDNPFSPKAFFETFAGHIPATVPANHTVHPQDVVRFRRDVEDAHKVYYCGWRDNTVSGENVTEKNLRKTRELLGQQAYERCKAKNLSTCWTDDRERAITFKLP
ncbi:DUF6037 family protein [Ralstonia solanacearum]|uniref:DUF6037 family protein n=1 Tax=Ralstonia solanacearum TaxID=305 RepID=UPI0023062895|nr:DUF6037 family protein [Ralstonia solanacearum]MDB0510053.1 DUF6037 family protein [Ralstonia solanacearum]MDB0514746.1 DUF6037 family protein [Ralstonia solanacearum]